MSAHLDFILRLADTQLIWSHRLSEWCGHGPALEEDIALANIALDALGQARLLYAHAQSLDRDGRTEDQFAYFRDASEFCNASIAELANGDYAHTIVRNLILSAYSKTVWTTLKRGSDVVLAQIAEKALKESTYHFRHAADWTIRMGDSTAEARDRVEHAFADLWRFAHELFEDDDIDRAMQEQGVTIPGPTLHAAWEDEITPILHEATLARPPNSAFRSHGKQRIHTESLSLLLAEMQSVARAHPEAKW